ncbi:MAG: DMT family transporter [Pyramidobacter sp.]|nr:DMT family transporter [Pyramidobacter sp.]
MKHGYALLFGICAVSTGAIFARLASAPSLAVAAWRMIISGGVLLPAAFWLKRDELKRISRRNARDLMLAGFFLALHFAFWISSLSLTSVASSVLFVNTAPLWTALFAPFISGERISAKSAAGILLSVAGACAIGFGDMSADAEALKGDALALAGAAALALYLLMGQRVRNTLSTLPYTGVCYSISCLWLLLFCLATKTPLTGWEPQTWSALAALALVPQIIGHTTYNWALKECSAVLVSVSLMGEPVCSSLMAWVIFGEKLTPVFLAGSALTLFGIWLASQKN